MGRARLNDRERLRKTDTQNGWTISPRYNEIRGERAAAMSLCIRKGYLETQPRMKHSTRHTIPLHAAFAIVCAELEAIGQGQRHLFGRAAWTIAFVDVGRAGWLVHLLSALRPM